MKLARTRTQQMPLLLEVQAIKICKHIYYYGMHDKYSNYDASLRSFGLSFLQAPTTPIKAPKLRNGQIPKD
jgi:hypothetical protein